MMISPEIIMPKTPKAPSARSVPGGTAYVPVAPSPGLIG
jgi:hypothetical protein